MDHSVREAGEEPLPDQERAIMDREEHLAESGISDARRPFPQEQRSRGC
jgi:hypothetical protein